MRGEEGFTLVEMLVALVAGGLLLASLGWLTGMFGHEVRSAARNDGFGQLAEIAPSLTSLLETIRPADGTGKLDADEAHLTGQVDPPLSRAGSGPMRLDLAVVRDRDGEALDLKLSGSDTQADAETERRLVHGFKAITIDVQQAEPAGGASRLITVGFTTPTGESWDLVVEPRLNAVGGCRFDPISMACRP